MADSIHVRLIPTTPEDPETGFYVDCDACGDQDGQFIPLGFAEDRVEGDQMAMEHLESHGVDISPWVNPR